MLRELTEKAEKGQNLSEEEAFDALGGILTGDPSDDEIAEFLVALADKEESVDEITGFARGMKKLAVPVASDHDLSVDTAGTGGGAATFNISTAAAFVIAGAGVPVAKHGNRAITSKSGSADVLSELGVNLDVPHERVESCLNEEGICFMFAPHFHPAMKRVAKIRQELGRKTIFNMVGPLTNPAGAPCQIIGVYSPDLTAKLAECLQRLGCKRGWVVHGHDGLDEISISDATYVAEVKDQEVNAFDFKPLETTLGVPAGGTPDENAVLIRGILEGNITGPARDIVALNAAAAIHIVTDLHMSAALKRAEESIRSGAALEKLRRLRDAYED